MRNWDPILPNLFPDTVARSLCTPIRIALAISSNQPGLATSATVCVAFSRHASILDGRNDYWKRLVQDLTPLPYRGATASASQNRLAPDGYPRYRESSRHAHGWNDTHTATASLASAVRRARSCRPIPQPLLPLFLSTAPSLFREAGGRSPITLSPARVRHFWVDLLFSILQYIENNE